MYAGILPTYLYNQTTMEKENTEKRDSYKS